MFRSLAPFAVKVKLDEPRYSLSSQQCSVLPSATGTSGMGAGSEGGNMGVEVSLKDAKILVGDAQ